jgi:hypothetical protein
VIGWEGSLVCWFVGLCVGWLEGKDWAVRGRSLGWEGQLGSLAGWLVACLLARLLICWAGVIDLGGSLVRSWLVSRLLVCVVAWLLHLCVVIRIWILHCQRWS